MTEEMYHEVFKGVHPSDESIERMIKLTEKKKRYPIRALAVAVAVISILFVSCVIVNAATDGAVKDSVSQVAEAIEQKITFVINGKNKDTADLTEDEKVVVDNLMECFSELDRNINITIETNEEDGQIVYIKSVAELAE